MRVITEKAAQGSVCNEQILVSIFKKLLKSFAEMEAVGIFHGDIKPQHIIADDFLNMKIIGFRVSASSTTGIHLIQGTGSYLAPELEALVSQWQDIRLTVLRSLMFFRSQWFCCRY